MLESHLKDPELVQVVRLGDDGCAFEGPGYIHSLSIACSDGGAATSALYDGVDTTGKLILDITSLASTTFQYSYDPPIKVKHGFYATLGAQVTSLTIQFQALKE